MQANLGGINLGKEIPTEHKDQAAGQNAKSQKAGRKDNGLFKREAQCAAVAVAESLEGALESLLLPTEKSLFLAAVFFRNVLVFGAQQVHRHRRYAGAGPHI